MTQTEFHQVLIDYPSFKINELRSRWIKQRDIAPYLKIFENTGVMKRKSIGKSEKGRDIELITIGEGDFSILGWTQMHGNEATSTLACLDLLNWLTQPKSTAITDQILRKVTINLVLILNPDGAEEFTRVNSKNVDINRDYLNSESIETQCFHKVFTNVNPSLCLNLHDQRNIFGTPSNKPATLSFLAPSANQEKRVTDSVKLSRALIGAMVNDLNVIFPETEYSKYTDDFYPNAFGDNIQKKGIPVILFECGPALKDPNRNEARKQNFMALISLLMHVHKDYTFQESDERNYLNLPFNKENFYDILITNYSKNGINLQVGLNEELFVSENELKTRLIVQEIAPVIKRNAYNTYSTSEFNISSNLEVGSVVKK